jgi:uncharacterized protein
MGFGYENLKMAKVSKDLEMARQSMVEELQAIDFYQQRIEITSDPELKKLLAHNMNEEKEHAAMLFQYVMKRDRIQADKYKNHD